MRTEQSNEEIEYVSVMIGSQLFALPITQVHDVFLVLRLTPVPLAPPEIAGVLNLRGRIITLIDMRKRMGLPPPPDVAERMAIGIEQGGESYGLLVCSVGEVLKLPAASREPNPVNLDPAWAGVAAGVHRLENGLMVVLDVDRVLDLSHRALAA